MAAESDVGGIGPLLHIVRPSSPALHSVGSCPRVAGEGVCPSLCQSQGQPPGAGPGLLQDCRCVGRVRLVSRGPGSGGGLHAAACSGRLSDFGKIGTNCCKVTEQRCREVCHAAAREGWDTARGATLFITDRQKTRAGFECLGCGPSLDVAGLAQRSVEAFPTGGALGVS